MTPNERAELVAAMGARHAWWASRAEAAIEPERAIIDAHVHFWQPTAVPDPAVSGHTLHTSRFMPDDFAALTGGHRVAGIVYIECGSGYDSGGDPVFAPVGETRFAAALAQQMDAAGQPPIAAIAPFADLRSPYLGRILDAHVDAGAGRVKTVRQSGANMPDPAARLLAGAADPDLYRDPAFRRGVAELGARGLPFEAFQFHHQLRDLRDLALETPGTIIIVNHLGAPIGFGRGAAGDDQVFTDWRHAIQRLAALPNVVMKLGGLASPVTEYDAARREQPPSSDEFVAERGRYFSAAIDAFGPDRCLFESNFPVDSVAIPYGTLWNAFKKIAGAYTKAEGDALLAGTARRIYGLEG